MATICRVVRNVGKQILFQSSSRNSSQHAGLQKIKIVERQEGDDLVIEGIKVDFSKDPLMLKNESDACALCALDVDVKHTDVLILKQFMRPDGCVLPRRITGLCNTQQKRISYMVTMAQKAGLIPNMVPGNRTSNPLKRREWKKFHVYYDEATIPYRLR